MNKEQTNESQVPKEKQQSKAEIKSLPKMEMYAVLGLELQQEILKRLEKIEDSIEILARQKARELNPKE